MYSFSPRVADAAGLVVSTFALVFAAEWGDKSFLATIALAATSSPVGQWCRLRVQCCGLRPCRNVASIDVVSTRQRAAWGRSMCFDAAAGVVGGAVAGHGLATVIAILGGNVLSRYVSEKTLQYM